MLQVLPCGCYPSVLLKTLSRRDSILRDAIRHILLTQVRVSVYTNSAHKAVIANHNESSKKKKNSDQHSDTMGVEGTQ